MSHTPGPWETFLPGRKFVHSVRNFNAICELNTHEREPEVVDANARLIAAAPDLLAACEAALTLVATMQGMPPKPEYIEEVREKLEESIGKAKGGPS